MDKIWDRKSFEVVARCGGDENHESPRRTDNSRTLKKLEKLKNIHVVCESLHEEESNISRTKNKHGYMDQWN